VSERIIFGINYSKTLCYRVGLNNNSKIIDISDDIKKNLTKYINLECIIDRELKSLEVSDIKTKLIIKSYQGVRHLQGLPVNGQNTKNNSKTAKSLLRKNLNDNK
jgi:small subunit ribosomal protein S13